MIKAGYAQLTETFISMSKAFKLNINWKCKADCKNTDNLAQLFVDFELVTGTTLPIM